MPEKKIKRIKKLNKKFESTVSPIRDNLGKIFAAVIIHRDISERKKIERALQESEEKYRSVVDNIGLGVSIISPKRE